MARPERRDRLDGAEAIVLVGVSFLLLATVGGAVAGQWGAAGQCAVELMLVAMPAIGWAVARGLDLRAAFGWRMPSAASVAGAVLVGAAGFYLVAAGLEALQEKLVPLPPALREELRRRIVPPSGMRPLAVDLLSLAILPALCEEVLFRGLVQGALRRFGALASVGGTALLFGFFHANPWVLLPTAALGALMGIARLRSASIVPAMIVHVVNNTLVILLIRAGQDEPPAVTSQTGALLFAGALLVLPLGFWLMRARSVTPARDAIVDER